MKKIFLALLLTPSIVFAGYTGKVKGDGSELVNVPGDNLGNHIATTTLDMGGYDIKTSSGISGLQKIVWSDGTIQVSSGTGGGGGGFVNPATANLDMNTNFQIVNVSTITFVDGVIVLNPPGTGGNNSAYGISIGSNSYGNFNYGLGVGVSAYNNSSSGVGIGRGASGNLAYGVGVGYGASGNNSYGVGIGNNALNNYSYGLGIGKESSYNYTGGIGIGRESNHNNNYGIGIGYYSQYNDNYAIGIGYYSQNNDIYSIGIGAYSQYNFAYSVSLGAYTCSLSSSVALGYSAKAYANDSLALGAGTVNNSSFTASFGQYAIYTASDVVAAGNVGIGITSPRAKLEVTGAIRAPKILLTPEGGYAVMLINNEGSPVSSGTIVNSTGSSVDWGFKVNPLAGTQSFGVVYGSTSTVPPSMGTCATGAWCWVVTSGIAYVNATGDASCVRGEWAGASATNAGQIECTTEPASTAQHDREVGHVVVSKAANYAWIMLTLGR